MEAMMPVGMSPRANELQKKNVIFMKFLASVSTPACPRYRRGGQQRAALERRRAPGQRAASPPLAGAAR
jgi:hypothetical protein